MRAQARKNWMLEAAGIWLQLALTMTALGLVLRERRHRPEARSASRGLATVASLSVAAWFAFGVLGGRGFLHRWELFHHALGAKHFPALGYDGLYVASYAAQRESEPRLPLPTHLLDLRSDHLVPAATLARHREEVVSRFSPDGWRTFLRDHRDFLDHSRLSYLDAMRLDHGLNASPAWIFVARLFVAHLPLRTGSLLLVALLDPLLVALMFGAIFHTFGSRAGCLSLILFALLYPAQFGWTGGAFLRQDWLAASGLAICWLARGRALGAGALWGYAAAVRLFPAAFLFGPLVAKADARSRLRLAAGFCLTLAIGAAAGVGAGRGPAAWREFAARIEQRRGDWLTNDVGLAPAVLYDQATFRRELVEGRAPDPWRRWQLHMDRRRRELRWLLAAAALAIIGIAALASRRAPPHEAAVLSLAVVFAVVPLPCYYEVMLLLVPLARHALASTAALLAANVAFYAVSLLSPFSEVRYGAVSWGLALFFVGWLLAQALRTAPDAEGLPEQMELTSIQSSAPHGSTNEAAGETPR
jgi:hypothetical protein